MFNAGVMCEEDIDECVSASCFPGVSCENTLGSFVCGSCPDHFTGDGKNCIREFIYVICTCSVTEKICPLS